MITTICLHVKILAIDDKTKAKQIEQTTNNDVKEE